mgnify:CR=1 FL=1
MHAVTAVARILLYSFEINHCVKFRFQLVDKSLHVMTKKNTVETVIRWKEPKLGVRKTRALAADKDNAGFGRKPLIWEWEMYLLST